MLHYLIYTKTTFNEKQGAQTWRANETETIVQMCKVITSVLEIKMLDAPSHFQQETKWHKDRLTAGILHGDVN